MRAALRLPCYSNLVSQVPTRLVSVRISLCGRNLNLAWKSLWRGIKISNRHGKEFANRI